MPSYILRSKHQCLPLLTDHCSWPEYLKLYAAKRSCGWHMIRQPHTMFKGTKRDGHSVPLLGKRRAPQKLQGGSESAQRREKPLAAVRILFPRNHCTVASMTVFTREETKTYHEHATLFAEQQGPTANLYINFRPPQVYVLSLLDPHAAFPAHLPPLRNKTWSCVRRMRQSTVQF